METTHPTPCHFGSPLLGAMETATATYGVVPPAGIARLVSGRRGSEQIAQSLDPTTFKAAKARGRRLSLNERNVTVR